MRRANGDQRTVQEDLSFSKQFISLYIITVQAQVAVQINTSTNSNFEFIREKEVCAHDHHGFSPVLKSVSDHGENNTLPSATSTWAKANDCKNRKHTCYISH
jgi:hypothetical protein